MVLQASCCCPHGGNTTHVETPDVETPHTWKRRTRGNTAHVETPHTWKRRTCGNAAQGTALAHTRPPSRDNCPSVLGFFKFLCTGNTVQIHHTLVTDYMHAHKPSRAQLCLWKWNNQQQHLCQRGGQAPQSWPESSLWPTGPHAPAPERVTPPPPPQP